MYSVRCEVAKGGRAEFGNDPQDAPRYTKTWGKLFVTSHLATQNITTALPVEFVIVQYKCLGA